MCIATVEEGKNGYLVPVKDSEVLSDTIDMLISDKNKMKDFGAYSRVKAVRDFKEKVILKGVVGKFFNT